MEGDMVDDPTQTLRKTDEKRLEELRFALDV